MQALLRFNFGLLTALMLTYHKIPRHLSLSLFYQLSFYRSRIILKKGGGRKIKKLQCQKENKWKYFFWQENFFWLLSFEESILLT
jgi:hypothetical protein